MCICTQYNCALSMARPVAWLTVSGHKLLLIIVSVLFLSNGANDLKVHMYKAVMCSVDHARLDLMSCIIYLNLQYFTAIEMLFAMP